ncbi:MAG TPA: sulfite exporter TauE/SafE family protein [Pseudomonas sp.]|uniref:sulfite exporter TauE/SafE family protein n=1 Tax=Pseudomonas sp. TaxID=306 RepID=UPI002ED7F675
MQVELILMLFFAGVVGGLVNAIAGGATLITFPAMIAAGLPPIAANASNAVAISPGHLIAAIADWEKFPPLNRQLVRSLVAAAFGGVAGALLLLATPDRYFVLPVPVLIGFATALFAFAPQVQAWAIRRRAGASASPVVELGVIVGASIYGGFFGAGLGIILTAVLSVAEPNDIRRVKVLKNLLATAVSLAAVTIFIAQGTVYWRETLSMLVGALFGGYAGGYLVRVLPAQAVRSVVIIAGLATTIFYGWKYWY